MKPSAHLVALDVWRGLAISCLLLGHFVDPRGINFGRLGVELFFVLSGFLMGNLLFVREIPLSTFYRRRISRIFPAAYTFIFVIVVVYLALGRTIPVSTPIWTSLFVVNYKLALFPAEKIGLPFQHFWSLCIEEHTYVVLSLLAIAHRRLRLPTGRMLAAGVLIVFVIAAVVGSRNQWDHHLVYWRTECRASSILLGAIASVFASRGIGRNSRYFGVAAPYLGTAFMTAGMLLQANRIPDYVKFTGGSALLAVGVLLVSQHGSTIWLWRLAPLAWLGTISYSLYLWQQPFYFLSEEGMHPMLALAATFMAAILSYFLIERPARSWLNKHWGTQPKRLVAEATASA